MNAELTHQANQKDDAFQVLRKAAVDATYTWLMGTQASMGRENAEFVRDSVAATVAIIFRLGQVKNLDMSAPVGEILDDEISIEPLPTLRIMLEKATALVYARLTGHAIAQIMVYELFGVWCTHEATKHMSGDSLAADFESVKRIQAKKSMTDEECLTVLAATTDMISDFLCVFAVEEEIVDQMMVFSADTTVQQIVDRGEAVLTTFDLPKGVSRTDILGVARHHFASQLPNLHIGEDAMHYIRGMEEFVRANLCSEGE